MKKNNLCLLVLGAAIFALALGGCGKKGEEAGTTEQPAQKAAEPGAGGTTAAAPATSEPARTDTAQTAAPAAPAAPAAKTPPPPPPPRKVTLDPGTPIKVVTSIEISTKTSKTGDPFEASLAEDIRDGDWLIARKGAPVTGVVANSDPGGKVKGVASIEVRLKKLTLADGRSIDLSTNAYSAQAKSTKKKDAAKIGIGAGVGTAIGAIAGGGKGAAIGAAVGGGAGTAAVVATRGEPAQIPSETLISFKLSAPVEITEKK
jgi:hypothetical protein